MKAKKAFKRLKRAEVLLSSVLHEYAGTHPQIRGLVASAKASVRIAKEAIAHPSSPPAKKRVPAKVEDGGQQRPKQRGRTRLARTNPRGRVAKRPASSKSTSKTKKRVAQKLPAVSNYSNKTVRVKKAAASRRVLRQPETGSVVTLTAEATSAKSSQTAPETAEALTGNET
jgi:hypothetical protein